ncbi:MAG: hypothetical protein M0006_02320 [Magnetospirillum sp.]|nr:hypothetical protein [Magnetospirillum sp.]
MAAPKEGAAPETETVTVAPGRTVWNGGRKHGPGDSLGVEAAEAKRLRALGFLVDPAAPALPVGQGPTFSPAEGPTVTRPGG